MGKFLRSVEEENKVVSDEEKVFELGEVQKISSIQVKEQRDVVAMNDCATQSDQIMEDEFSGHSEAIQNIFTEVVDIHQRLIKIIQFYNPTIVDWWASDNPLVRLWGQISADAQLLDEDQVTRDVFTLFGEPGLSKFKNINRSLKMEVLRKHFPNVDFDNLLKKV